MKQPNHVAANESLELNLTSMIDVIFLLLIFFVCTADFKKPEKTLPTNLNLPGAVANERIPQQERDLGKIVVRVLVMPSRNVMYSVDGKRVASIAEVEALLDSLSEIDSNTPVVVAPERDVPLERVLDVYDCARRVGLGKIKFAASPESFAL